MTIDEAIEHCLEVAEQNEAMAWSVGNRLIGSPIAKYQNECEQCAADHRRLAEWLTDYKKSQEELAEAKRLLKLAIEDFAKLDRENTKNKNCMMPEMDCANCPLSWDSVDDRIEPCHSWRYTNEALKLIWR